MPCMLMNAPLLHAWSMQVLHGISGKAVSGRLFALMGPSGAGKTSLVREHGIWAREVPRHGCSSLPGLPGAVQYCCQRAAHPFAPFPPAATYQHAHPLPLHACHALHIPLPPRIQQLDILAGVPVVGKAAGRVQLDHCYIGPEAAAPQSGGRAALGRLTSAWRRGGGGGDDDMAPVAETGGHSASGAHVAHAPSMGGGNGQHQLSASAARKRSRTCYVQQRDVLMPSATVRAFRFRGLAPAAAAWLLQPG